MRYRFLRFPDGKERALTLSYDDANKTDIELLRICDQYGIKVTLNVNSGFIPMERDDGHVSVETLKRITKNGGHEIAVHGRCHIAPGKASAISGIEDVLLCRKELERAFGGIIRGMAYPDSGIRVITGETSLEQIKQYLKMLGIVYARTLGKDNDDFKIPNDFYEWMPSAHHNNPKLFEYLDKFLNEPLPEYCASREPKLFYLWGHSFEFANANNWEVLEAFCQKAGGREDVWYATNIEICNYVNAYYSLVFNVDNTLVYNPTTTKVWFEADGKMVCVASGETVSF